MIHDQTMSQVMTRNPVCIEPGERLDSAKALMLRHGIRHLPVAVDRELVGILLERDLHRGLAFRYPDALQVSDLMLERPYTLTPACKLVDALRMMADYKVEAIPVISGRRRLEGIFTRHDALRSVVWLDRGARREAVLKAA